MFLVYKVKFGQCRKYLLRNVIYVYNNCQKQNACIKTLYMKI